MFFWCFSEEPTIVTASIWPRRIGVDLTLEFWPPVMVNERHLAYGEMGLLHFDSLFRMYHFHYEL